MSASHEKKVFDRASQTEPETIRRTVRDAVQLSLPRTFVDWREIIYGALVHDVDETYEKRENFADDVGINNRDLSLRLRHAECSKGYAQLAPVDFLAHLADHGGLDTFLADVAAEKGYRLVPLQPPSAQEMAEAMGEELTPKRKRAVEKEKGWPKGTLR